MQESARLKIWVCEFISAGGLAAESLPASLLQEGLLMRDALLAQLHALGIDCITSHDARVPAPVHARSIVIDGDAAPFSIWQQQLAAEEMDACWVIAPETDQILSRMQQLVTQSGKHWLGCDRMAIELTTDKARMAEHCAGFHLPVLPHQFLQMATVTSMARLTYGHGWVVKPLDGAGCEHTYYFKNDVQLSEFKEKISIDNPNLLPRLLLQPYLPGQPLSMSVISTAQQAKVIAAHHQHIRIDEDGCIAFHGAGIHQAAAYLPQMQALATRIQQAIPGLSGYWGADLILTSAGALVLVEINPRLTTPFIALSRVMAQNPAALVLDAILQQKLPAVTASSEYAMDLNME